MQNEVKFNLQRESRISERFTNGVYFIRTKTKNLEDYLTIINNCLELGYRPFNIVLISDIQENENFCNELEKHFNIPVFFLSTEKYKNLILEFYNEKPRNFIGITGSSGKSSIAIGLFNILKHYFQKKTFIASSAGLGSENLMTNSLSSMPFADLYYYLNLYKDSEYAILEMTSHGLHQKRMEGITLDIAIITNIQENHLDYHKNMEEYIKCKLEIIKYLKNNGTLFIVKDLLDHPSFNENLKKLFNDYTSNINVIILENEINILDFNIYQNFNVNACVSILKHLIKNSTKELSLIDWKSIFPSGRFIEISNINTNSIIVLDGAHNPDQISNIIDIYQNKFPEKKMIILYGIAGHRIITDSKNPLIIDQKLRSQDTYLIVDDQPQNIDADLICNNIFKQCTKKTQVINQGNRFLAIEKACGENNSCILILGKTSEVRNLIEFQYNLNNWEDFFTKKLSYFKFISEIKINPYLSNLSTNIYKKIENMNFKMYSNLHFIDEDKKNSIILNILKKNDSINFIIDYDEINLVKSFI